MTVTVQVVPAGRFAVGSRVIVLVPEPLTVKACVLPGVGHSIVKELVVTSTASLKLTTMLALGAWFVAPLVGVVVVTAGRASTVIVTVAVSFGVKPLVAV